ncbi:hypothetical protein FKW77_003504 [Venturia effusa]|uniref:Uncharacterized protein n=1 Tax=Venturia effusa TaxID=50376 RepID=A0A517LGV5_9PEZI|nr:hypothetical protein FKW77_003504 [Venturia effusa]
MSILQVLLCLMGLGSFVIAQNATTPSVISFTISNSTTSNTVPSTVFVTSTPGGGVETATTFITSSGFQNTTQSSSAFEIPEPTFTSPIFTSPFNTPNSPASPTPTLLSKAPALEFHVLPILSAVVSFLIGMCVLY